MFSRHRLAKAALVFTLAVATLPAVQPAVHAALPVDSLADLEAAVLGHSCPTPETIAVLTQSPTEANSAAAILLAGRAANSPVVGALFDMYWSARDGVPTSANSYDLAEFATCFAGGLDLSRYEERLQQAAQSIDAVDEQVQVLVDDGTATIDGTVRTVRELSEPVIALALDRVGESSTLALALLLELLTKASMLQYTSHGSPGVDLEAAARPEVNDVHMAALDATDPLVESVPPVTEAVWPVRRCKFRQTQAGDREGGTPEMTFTVTNDPPIGFQHDLYRLTNYRSTYLYNVDLKCVKFAAMPDGSFDFDDRTPFPENLVCGWRVLEPYGYQKYYEFVAGYPQSGYMMRNIYDVVFECDTLYVPIFKLQFDRDCPYNNVYAHYDNGVSHYYGEPTSVCR